LQEREHLGDLLYGEQALQFHAVVIGCGREFLRLLQPHS
jgi:hypothetical protein